MSYFAKVENGVVTNVIVADADFINAGHAGDPSEWVETKYASIGYLLNVETNKLYAPAPFPSWILNTVTLKWYPPTPRPNDGKSYVWDEQTVSWVETVVLDQGAPNGS